MPRRSPAWDDPGLYDRRYEKTASALIAIAGTLEDERPLGGREESFLRLYRGVAAANPSDFTEIWREPIACYWTIVAYQLLGACLTRGPLPALARDYCAARGIEDPAAALAAHLGEFARLALGVAVVSGGECLLPEPLAAPLPLAIPGTEWIVGGSGMVILRGFVNGRLRVRQDGGDVERPLVERCPVARVGDVAVRLQPAALVIPGSGWGRFFENLDPGYQARHAALVEQALALVAGHHAEAFEQLREILRVIALKPPKAGDLTNASHSDLPGAFVLSVVAEPYTLADSIIHELSHNRLFFVEDDGDLFAESEYTLGDAGAHYSPWRPDPRPGQGIFHGLYVYAAVGRFWLSVVRSGETSGLTRDYAVDQLVRTILQCRIATVQLERCVALTARGAELFRALRDEVAALGAAADALGVPRDPPAIVCSESGVLSHRIALGSATSVREDLLDHLRRVTSPGGAADLEALLATA